MKIERLILSSPTLLAPTGATRSWIQLAKCGHFVSNRYGKFSITRDDLSTMLRNFDTVTPKDPTELPIDYDHLSMDPKKPGDGIAAGWMKRLELRDQGETLWAEVEWTPDGAARIKNKEYRFVSPSFVKDHVHKDGTKIGTTLLAAAITNHPFLEGMDALTLYSLNNYGELGATADQRREYLAVEDTGDRRAFGEYALSEVGQRVMIAPGNARTQDEIGGTFEITEVVGEGEDAFVTIKDANGVPHKWFRATELLPASAVPANPIQPNLVPAPGQPGMPGMPGAGGGGGGGGVPNGDPAAAGLDPAAAAAAGLDPAAAAAAAVDPAAAAAAGLDPEAAAAAGLDPEAAEELEEADEEDPDAEEGEEDAEDDEEDLEDGEEPAAKPDDEVEALIKQRVAAILAAGKQQQGIMKPKGFAMMFKLRNDKNEEIQVTDEQLAAAGIRVVPEGSTAIPVSELSDMKTTITSLSTRVETLAAETVASKQRGVLLELHTELARLSRGGFITKATRDALEAQFGQATDLSGFKVLAATFTTPILTLNKEHGSGGDAPADVSNATQKLMSLSNQLVKERGMSLRDATIEAGRQLADDAEEYQARFRPQEVGV